MRRAFFAALAAATVASSDSEARDLRDASASAPSAIKSKDASVTKKAKTLPAIKNSAPKHAPESSKGHSKEDSTFVGYLAMQEKLKGVALELRGPEYIQKAYEEFCRELEIFCTKYADFRQDRTYHQRFTRESFSAISRINTEVNTQVKPKEDLLLYGVIEKWTIPHDAGDCEDYVLLKMARLLDAGFSPLDLHILVVFDEKNEGHAVLGVDVHDRDRRNTLVLDNKHSDILTLDEMETRYKGSLASFVTYKEGKVKVRFYEYASKRGR